MKKLTKKFRARLGAGLLAGVMLFGSLPLTAMAASGQDDLLHGSIKASAIQLETAPTKMMDYYAAADEPAGIQWVTDADAVSFLPAAATEGDVTCAVKATDGAVWIGTQNGLMRMDLTEKDPRDMVQYFAGNRYMYTIRSWRHLTSGTTARRSGRRTPSTPSSISWPIRKRPMWT